MNGHATRCTAGRVATTCLALAGLTMGAACGATPRYIQSGGVESLTSLRQIPTRALNNAAAALVQDLLSRGIFQRAKKKPVILAVVPVVNDTSVMVDTALLTKQIRVALNKSGDVQTITTYGGYVEDPIAAEQRQMAAFERGTAPDNRPDFSLSGAIRENRVRSGRDREVTYSFDLNLTDTKTGLAPWEGTEPITLQGTKPAFGF